MAKRKKSKLPPLNWKPGAGDSVKHVPVVVPVPALARLSGAPHVRGDYRIKVKEHLPECHTIDHVDEDYLYGRERGFWGFASFKIDRTLVEWHEPIP
jgi:hypothetical protein